MMWGPRGFERSEFEGRAARAQARMAQLGLSALLLTTEPEIRYYTGYLTRFWESPTRMWFVILPADGTPIAVIPSIGAHLMGQTWVSDIRTWTAPDHDDQGIALLADSLAEVPPLGCAIGLADGPESFVRLPRARLDALINALAGRRLVSDQGITAALRAVKSKAEIAKLQTATAIADRSFDRVAEIAQTGVPLSSVFRNFQRLCLEEGADWVPYLAGAAGQGGYHDVISPATDDPLRAGDVLMLDTGLVWDGYFCDFDRNYSLGAPTAETISAHHQLIDASQAAFETAKPEALVCDLYHAMRRSLGAETVPGRLGHGLGQQLTEGVSLIPSDHTPLQAGMVLTLEPAMSVGTGKLMVHEENIVITQQGAAYLSAPQSRDIRVL